METLLVLEKKFWMAYSLEALILGHSLGENVFVVLWIRILRSDQGPRTGTVLMPCSAVSMSSIFHRRISPFKKSCSMLLLLSLYLLRPALRDPCCDALQADRALLMTFSKSLSVCFCFSVSASGLLSFCECDYPLVSICFSATPWFISCD